MGSVAVGAFIEVATGTLGPWSAKGTEARCDIR